MTFQDLVQIIIVVLLIVSPPVLIALLVRIRPIYKLSQHRRHCVLAMLVTANDPAGRICPAKMS